MKVVINHCYGGFGFSEEATNILLERLGEDGYQEMERHDPIFVSLLEEMGESINTNYSKLVVVEIEDGLDYEIEEYDGMESVSGYLSVTKEELSNGLSEEKMSLLKYTHTIKIK